MGRNVCHTYYVVKKSIYFTFVLAINCTSNIKIVFSLPNVITSAAKCNHCYILLTNGPCAKCKKVAAKSKKIFFKQIVTKTAVKCNNASKCNTAAKCYN